MPYKNETDLTGKMLYERADYYYKKATKTHFWQGAPETDMEELKQAGIYYSSALAKGYRPKTGYDRLLEYYDNEGDIKIQEAGYAALIEAFPEKINYRYARAISRKNNKDYKGALQDLNHIVKHDFIDLEEAYYMRGAVKYVLNPKDTADAEADRMTALNLRKKNATLDSYHVYCIVYQLDSMPYDKDDPAFEKDLKKQEAENTAMIKAHPDSTEYWYYRALNRQQLRNYEGALGDFNRALTPGADHKKINLETAYYLRGAVKYRLNPKDTTEAEADRWAATKLHRENAISVPYSSYCEDW